jgi:hypothetical protein
MADNGKTEREDDHDDDRRQFIARFGKLALVAAPTVAVLVTSMNSRAIAASCTKMCPPGEKPDDQCNTCQCIIPGTCH